MMPETTTLGPILEPTRCHVGAATLNRCPRPVGTESLYPDEPPTLCAEHYRTARADEEASDWQSAHDVIVEHIAPAFDNEYPGHLERVMEGVLDKARIETALAHREYEVATWMEAYDHETNRSPRPLSGPEDLEQGYRLLTRSDRLIEAFYALYRDGKDLTSKQWRMLGTIQEVQQEASAEFDRWRGDAAPPA